MLMIDSCGESGKYPTVHYKPFLEKIVNPVVKNFHIVMESL
jgi:hypothetical protein